MRYVAVSEGTERHATSLHSLSPPSAARQALGGAMQLDYRTGLHFAQRGGVHGLIHQFQYSLKSPRYV